MANTTGRRWFERQLALLSAGDIAGLTRQYRDNAVLLFDSGGRIEGADAIATFFTQHLAYLGKMDLLSIDAFTETGDSCFAEATVATGIGEGRVVDTFILDGDRVRLHFNGVVSFIPAGSNGKNSSPKNSSTVKMLYELFDQGSLAAAQDRVFASDVYWNLPGHHPLGGAKQGITEVVDYFAELRRLGVKLEPIQIHDLDDELVGDIHREYAEYGDAKMDVENIAHYKMRDGRIAEVQIFLKNQYGADNFYSATCHLKGMPDRFA